MEWGLLVSVPVAALLVALIPAFRTWWQSRSLGLGDTAES
jgi:putative ABC transport system permease protein